MNWLFYFWLSGSFSTLISQYDALFDYVTLSQTCFRIGTLWYIYFLSMYIMMYFSTCMLWWTFQYVCHVALFNPYDMVLFLWYMPQTEEIGLKTITTAKPINSFSQDSPYISNTISRESPKFQTGFHVSQPSSCHFKRTPRKPANLEIHIFEVWSHPWVVRYDRQWHFMIGGHTSWLCSTQLVCLHVSRRVTCKDAHHEWVKEKAGGGVGGGDEYVYRRKTNAWTLREREREGEKERARERKMERESERGKKRGRDGGREERREVICVVCVGVCAGV